MLRLRYGLDGGGARMLAAVGACLDDARRHVPAGAGITRARVQQIEAKALRRLGWGRPR